MVIPFWSARRRYLGVVEITHSLVLQSLSTSAEAQKMALWVSTLCAEVDVK